MNEKRRRGRPPTFSESDRQQFAELIRQHGIRGTVRLVEIPISFPTLSASHGNSAFPCDGDGADAAPVGIDEALEKTRAVALMHHLCYDVGIKPHNTGDEQATPPAGGLEQAPPPRPGT